MASNSTRSGRWRISSPNRFTTSTPFLSFLMTVAPTSGRNREASHENTRLSSIA